MDFWPEFLASSWGREFVAGGCGGAAGIISGYPLDTLRIRQQQAGSGSAWSILSGVVRRDGPAGLYCGMGAPLASVTFQNAMVFQIYAVLSRTFDRPASPHDPPSYKGVALGGFCTGALQSLMLTPVELVKIRLQLQDRSAAANNRPFCGPSSTQPGPVCVARTVLRTEGVTGLYRGLMITMLRDAPAHGLYFWTYEYVREKLHSGCRRNGQETMRTMLFAGGLAGAVSWAGSYPLDVVKTRLQSQSGLSPARYAGITDCLRRSIREEGYGVLWRGLGTAVARAFVVNGAIFAAYELVLRCFFDNGNQADIRAEKCALDEVSGDALSS